jgi:hypothetical protein
VAVEEVAVEVEVEVERDRERKGREVGEEVRRRGASESGVSG